MAIESFSIADLLRAKADGRLFHRESQTLEFKEQFNLAGLADYFRDFAAFANNRGGNLVFGVSNSPRKAVGLSQSSVDQFERIDPERISGFLNGYFEPSIEWAQSLFEVGDKFFGVLSVGEARSKPVIAKSDQRDVLRNGDVYYRYGGRTTRIQYSELQNIIEARVQANNAEWMNLVQRIGEAGPGRSAVLDTERGLLSVDESQVLVIDEDLARRLKFIREGEFSEKQGATALRLVGDVVPAQATEVVKRVSESLTKQYPLSATEVMSQVKSECPEAKHNEVWAVIRDNDLKSNRYYSAYVFRNKRQEDEYNSQGTVPNGLTSIYNHQAVEYILKVLRSQSPDLQQAND